MAVTGRGSLKVFSGELTVDSALTAGTKLLRENRDTIFFEYINIILKGKIGIFRNFS